MRDLLKDRTNSPPAMGREGKNSEVVGDFKKKIQQASEGQKKRVMPSKVGTKASMNGRKCRINPADPAKECRKDILNPYKIQ